jgi:hypothetical protein
MALLIHGIDTPVFPFGPLQVGAFSILCLSYDRPAAGDPIGAGGETRAGQRIRRLREAIAHINRRIRVHTEANRAFLAIPGGRGFSLDTLLAGPDIIVCFDPVHHGPILAATPLVGRRISITEFGFRSTGRSVEATLIHELAHVNGASGTTRDAENVLRRSRMGDQFNPRVVG